MHQQAGCADGKSFCDSRRGTASGVRPASTAAAVEDGQLKAGWEEDVKDWGDKRVAVIGVVRG